MAGKSTMRSELESMPVLRDKAIVRVSMLPRKSAKLNPGGTRTATGHT